MSLLRRAMEGARSEEEIAAAQAIAVLSENPQDGAQADHFSTDPLSGYDAAQIALRLFDGGRLEEFSGFLKEKNLSPNIVLPNGLTLLQNSLFRYPQDENRLECLLSLGANPNLFMRRIEEEAFGNGAHRATYHPLNYAFANCPQLTTPEVCRTLRKYGASADGLRNYFEVDPAAAVPDDEAKAKLRRELIATVPDAELSKTVRRDVDLSVMQKHLANVETQLAAAGFQVVTYVPPRQAKARFNGPDTTLPVFENYHVISVPELEQKFKGSTSDNRGTRTNAILNYSGNRDLGNMWMISRVDRDEHISKSLVVNLTANDPQDVFAWLPEGASAGTMGQNSALASLKPKKFVFMNQINKTEFTCTVVGVYEDKNHVQFFYDPSINGVRTLSNDDKKVSLTDRSDILEGLTGSFVQMEIKEDPNDWQKMLTPTKTIQIDSSNRPAANGAGVTAPAFNR